MSFAKYLRSQLYGTPTGEYFCSTDKYFTNKIVENPLKKEKQNAKCYQGKTKLIFWSTGKTVKETGLVDRQNKNII